jgi:hypothetical protein
MNLETECPMLPVFPSAHSPLLIAIISFRWYDVNVTHGGKDMNDDQRLAELETQIKEAKARVAAAEKVWQEVKLRILGAHPVGSVLGWKAGGSGFAAGRVTSARVRYGDDVEYRVIRIKIDGTEGDPATLTRYNAPVLLAAEYEEGKIYAKPPQKATLPLAEIAGRINAHLKRFEDDPVIKPVLKQGTKSYYYAGAGVYGNRIGVIYISYQGKSNLKPVDAEAYLAWLDEGNVGTHYKWEREARK